MSLRHLTSIDLARRWNVSPRTLERWRGLGLPPKFLKLHGRVAYRLEEVEAFEAARLVGGCSEAPSPSGSRQ
jgi:hypothetical protein